MVDTDRSEDMCPICKTDRYLSPDMKFLINPECYHKMCESCVDRIFSLGPSQCPYPGCDKILRKNKFKLQIFDDIQVEREIDIRRKISSIFNKSITDFQNDLDKYNEYLEQVETIIFNLINNVDREETELNLQKYLDSNKEEIKENNTKKELEYQTFKDNEEFEKNLKLKKLLLEREIAQEEKQLNESVKRDILNKLSSSSTDPNETIKTYKKTILKKSSARRKQLDQIMKSLNQKKEETPESSSLPFSPFNGDRILVKDFKSNVSYYDPFIDELKTQKPYLAAGFKPELVYERVLSQAFIGLGIDIEKEKTSV